MLVVAVLLAMNAAAVVVGVRHGLAAGLVALLLMLAGFFTWWAYAILARRQ
jgi:hypothetical protein